MKKRRARFRAGTCGVAISIERRPAPRARKYKTHKTAVLPFRRPPHFVWMAGIAPATSWLSPTCSSAELHPETLRPGGWTCTSDLVGVSYMLLLLSYTRKWISSCAVVVERNRTSPERLCAGRGISRGVKPREQPASPVPDGPTSRVHTHEKTLCHQEESNLSRPLNRRLPPRTGSKQEPPRGVEPQPVTFEALRSIRGAVAIEPPRGLEPQPPELEAPRSILERWQ